MIEAFNTIAAMVRDEVPEVTVEIADTFTGVDEWLVLTNGDRHTTVTKKDLVECDDLLDVARAAISELSGDA